MLLSIESILLKLKFSYNIYTTTQTTNSIPKITRKYAITFYVYIKGTKKKKKRVQYESYDAHLGS